MYTMEYYSALGKGRHSSVCNNMDELEDIMVNETSQSQRKYRVIPL